MQRRPLYLTVEPSVQVLARIAALPRAARNRLLELVHVTMLAFVDLADVPQLLDNVQPAQAYPG